MNYTTIQFLMWCCLLGVPISISFIVFTIPRLFFAKTNYEMGNAWIRIGISVAVCIIAILFYFSLASQANKYLVDKVSSGYSVYYNGEAIDGTKVNFNDYSVSIDEEKEEIYLANKPVRTRRHVVPVVYPR